MRIRSAFGRRVFALAFIVLSGCQFSESMKGSAAKPLSDPPATPPTTPPTTPPPPADPNRAPVAATAVGATDGDFTVGQGGDASYSVGLKLVSGTAGIQPDIRLVYDSSGGDSPLGVGWTLSGQSVITRCPTSIESHGYVDAVDFDANDLFCLDGQRLIATAGAYGGDGTEYRTELDSFTRILSRGAAPGGGPARFVAYSKEGQIREYGGTEDSRVEAYRVGQSGQPTPATNWAINRVEDRSGNYMTYSYLKQNSRNGDGVFGTEHYLTRIDYTGNGAANLVPYASVRMEYETRPDLLDGYVAGALTLWNVRLKRVANYSGEQVIRSLDLFYRQSVAAGRSQLSAVQECGSDGTCFGATTFSTASAAPGVASTAQIVMQASVAGPGLLNKSEEGRHETFADVDGDGDLDRVWIPTGTQAIYVSLWVGGYFDLAKIWLQGSPPVASLEGKHEAWIDLNGDGKADRVWIPNNSEDMYVALSNGTAFVAPQVWLRDRVGGVETKSLNGLHETFADVDGDGLADRVWIPAPTCAGPIPTRFCTDGRTYMARNTGTAFADPIIFFPLHTGTPNFSKDGLYEDYIDLNGDGLTDYAWIPDGQSATQVTLASRDPSLLGPRFDPPTVWFGDDTRTLLDGRGRPNLRRWEDVTGDGLPDLVYSVASGECTELRVGVNYGRGLVNAKTWARSCAGEVPLSSTDARHQHFVDMNDDGRADHVWTPSDRASVWVSYSTGTSFGAPQQLIADNISAGDLGNIPSRSVTDEFFDADGDGTVDRVWIPENTPNGRFYYLKGNRASHLLTGLKNAFGREVQITYDTLMNPNVYTADNDAVFPVEDAHGTMSVVSQTRTSDGIGGLRARTYQYVGLKMHLHGIGSLGMRRTIELESDPARAVIHEYSQDYRLRTHGMLLAGGELLGAFVPTKHYQNTYRSDVIESPGGKRYVVQIATTDTTERDINNAFLSRRLTENLEADGWGNVKKSRTSVFNEQNQVVARTVIDSEYDNDAVAWSLGLLNKTTVTRSLPSANPAMPSIANTTAQSWDIARRLVLTETQEPENAELRLLREYDYDAFGNRTAATTSGPDITSRTTRSVYEETGRFVKETTNPFGQVTKTSYDTVKGLVEEVTTPDLGVTAYEYDGFGRQRLESRPDKTKARPSYVRCSANNCPPRAAYYMLTQADGASPVYTYLDILGREVRKQVTSLEGKAVFEDRTYDAQGRNAVETEPYFEGETPSLVTKMTYDDMDRVTRVDNPDGTFATVAYDGARTTYTNELQQARTEIRNVLGQKIEILDAENNSLKFRYDAHENLIETRDPAGNVITTEYDVLGRKKALTDPDMGRSTYDYNCLGQLIRQTDGKGQVTTLDYDKLGRLVTRVDDAGGRTQQATRWFYDTTPNGRGQILRAAQKPCPGMAADVEQCFEDLQQGGEFQQEHAYDALGRTSKVATTMGGERFEVGTTYDALSRVDTTTYPAGAGAPLKVKTVYNEFGYTSQLVNADTQDIYWNALTTDARGNLNLYRLGNNLQTRRDHDPKTGYLTRISTSIPETRTVQDLGLKFDAVGNLRSRQDALQSTGEIMTYDALNRLKTVETGNRLGHETHEVTYDALGNIKTRTGVGTYSYGGTCNGQKAGPHAVTSVAGETQTAYCYDKSGNMVQSGLRSVEYSSFHKPTRFVQETTETTFDYDPSRVRYRRRDATPQNGQVTTLYVGNIFEKSVGPKGTEYRSFIGDIAVFTEKVAPDQSIQKSTHYFHRDHLDSIEAITDEAANVVERFSFDAWGKRRNADWTQATDPTALTSNFTSRGFTNQEQIEAFGLVHMNGRVYDPVIGRFLSADPFVQDLDDLQAYNRYSYVRNNPMSATDPSGYFSLKKLVRKVVKAIKNYHRAVIRVIKGALRAVAKAFAKVPGLQQVANIAACIIPGGCLAFAAFSAAVSLSAGASLGDVLPGLALAVVGQAGPGGDLAGASQGLSRIAATTSKVLSSDIGRFAQSPVGQGLIAEAQGKKFKDGFLSALPGAVINGTPLILKALKYAPPTALHADGDSERETLEKFGDVGDAIGHALDGADGNHQPFSVGEGLRSAGGISVGVVGVVVDATQGIDAAQKGDWWGAGEGALGVGLGAADLAGKGIGAAGIHLQITYKIVHYEAEALQRLNWAFHRSDSFLSTEGGSSNIIGSTRPATQRQPLFSLQETRRNQLGRIWGADAEAEYQSGLGRLEQLRHNDQFNVKR